MKTQIFAYTGVHEVDEQHVRFVQAFKVDGSIEIHVRNGAGEINVCTLHGDQALELAMALNEAVD